MNSIYVFNKNALNLIPCTSKLAIKLIKSYFYLYSSKLEKKINKTKILSRYRKLASTRIFISKGEFKHTNNKVIITLYTLNRQKHNLLKIIKKRFKNLIKFDNSLFWSNTIYLKGYRLFKNKYKNYINKLNINKLIVYKQSLNKKKSTINPQLLEIFEDFLEEKLYKKIFLKKNLYFNNYYKIYEYYKVIEASIIKNINFNNKNLKKKDLNALVIDWKEKLKKVYLKVWVYNKLYIYHSYNERTTNFSFVQELINKNLYKIKSYSFLKHLLKIHKNIITILKKNKNIKIAFWLKKFFYSNSGLKKLKVKNLNVFLLTTFKKSFIKLLINVFEKKIYNIYYTKIKLYFFYQQIRYINKSKFNYTYLQHLTSLLKRLYNKNIEFNIINLKYFYLNSDILSQIITFKIRRNRRKTLKFLKTLIRKVKVKKLEKYINDPIEKLEKNISNLGIYIQDDYIIKNKTVKRNVINSLFYRKLTGVRLEAAGRLTRRYTASRSVFRCKYKGNLKNQDSSYKARSTLVLKGNQRSNIQYSFIKHNTRIGSFGIKGWVSGN